MINSQRLEKFEGQIYFKDKYEIIKIDPQTYIEKLYDLIRIYFREELMTSKYHILYHKNGYDSIDIVELINKNEKESIKVKDLLNKEDRIKGNFNMYIDLKDYEESIKFNIHFLNDEKSFLMLSNLSYDNLKYKILSLFSSISLDSLQIIYKEEDISLIYKGSTLIKEIFSSNNDLYLNYFVDYEKFYNKCNKCKNENKSFTCVICCTSLCSKCISFDIHYTKNIKELNNKSEYTLKFDENTKEKRSLYNSNQNSIFSLTNENSKEVSKYEAESSFILKSKASELMMVNQDKIIRSYNNNISNKLNSIESIINDIKFELNTKWNLLKDYHLKNIDELSIENQVFHENELILSKVISSINHEHGKFNDLDKRLQVIISNYKEILKINTKYIEINDKLSKSEGVYNELHNKFSQIKNETIKKLSTISLYDNNTYNTNTDNKSLLYKRIFKVYDNERILSFNYNKPKGEEFELYQFCDKSSLFKINFNNFIQINYKDYVFILTGSSSEKLFMYNHKTNDMEYINTLNFNHNWWPCLVLFEISNKIKFFCFSGTYTKSCEELCLDSLLLDKTDKTNSSDMLNTIMNLQWKPINQLSSARGQASSIIIDNKYIYLFFGYDHKHSSISTIERYNIISEIWENIPFINKGNISSYLYYHANLQSKPDEILIFGGRIGLDIRDNIYEFNFKSNTLSKSSQYNILDDVKFMNEKIFIDLSLYSDSYENRSYALFDNDNNIHLFCIKDEQNEIRYFNKDD